jgi:RNA polymerase sigma-70 factor (ECF subfamily)
LLHSRGDQLTRYHLEAGIAATHCAAKKFEETDWSAIVRYYDFLEKYALPLTPLNRAIAIGFRDGTEAAVSTLRAINKDAYFDEHAYYWAALGSFYFDAQDYQSAENAYQQALKCSRVKTDRQFLLKRIELCQNGLT